MEMILVCGPTNVCFSRVQVQELPGPATNISGCFTNTNAFTDLNHYPTLSWTNLTVQNLVVDNAGFDSIPKPWSSGEFDWKIPYAWRVEGSAATNVFGYALQQNIINDTNGTSTVKKFGAKTTRTP
jgi:hypothetical protein